MRIPYPYSYSIDAQQSCKLRHNGQRCRTCSKLYGIEKTLRRDDVSVHFRRQPCKLQTRRPQLSIPSQFSCSDVVGRLTGRCQAIPQRWWLAYLLLFGFAKIDSCQYLGVDISYAPRIIQSCRLYCMTSIRRAAGCMDLVPLEAARLRFATNVG